MVVKLALRKAVKLVAGTAVLMALKKESSVVVCLELLLVTFGVAKRDEN